MLLNISYAKEPLLVICNVNLSKKCVCVFFFIYMCCSFTLLFAK